MSRAHGANTPALTRIEPREKKIFNIGAPHNKTASSVFVSEPDLTQWKENLVSKQRADYVAPGPAKHPSMKDLCNNHRQSHFVLGMDPEESLQSETKGCYKGPPPGFQREKPCKISESGVQFGSKDFPWGKEVDSTTRSDFAKPFVAEEVPLLNLPLECCKNFVSRNLGQCWRGPW